MPSPLRPEPDPRAVRILKETYWGPNGWKTHWRDRRPPQPPPEQYAFAVRSGVMFPSADLSHDDVVDRTIELSHTVGREAVADAFLASLTTRRLDLRSALGSLAVARAMPPHSFTLRPGEGVCLICGAFGREPLTTDLNVLNFERFKWGGVRRLDPGYVAFDLERFSELRPVEPTEADLDVATRLFDRLRAAAAPGATPAALVAALTGAFPSNDPERRIVVEILACCGIVQPRATPQFRERWTEYFDRPTPPGRRNDWTFPVYAWKGDDGIDDAAIEATFPRLAAS